MKLRWHFLLILCMFVPCWSSPSFGQTSRQKNTKPRSQNNSKSPARRNAKKKTKAKKVEDAIFADKKSGARGMFASAQKLFNERKYSQALIAFDRVLRKYPGHQPTIIQYAKTLYKLDRVPESHRFFSRINPMGLDVETSYEYALSHFWMRQYQGALYGFQRIPEGHALADLANYYGGISALKVRRLVEAESMMEKAVVLPVKLARSRKNYLRHIRSMKLIYEKKGLAEDRKREKARIEAKIKKEDPGKLTAKETEKEIKKYKHGGFESVSTSAKVGVAFKNQTVDFHGFGEKHFKIRSSYFEFKGGPLVPIPFYAKGGQAAVGAQIELKGEEVLTEGEERRNIKSDSLEDIERIETQDIERSLTKYGSLIFRPWLEFPTHAKIWVNFGGRLSYTYPDFEVVNRSGIRAGYVRIGSKEKGKNYSLKYQYGEILDKENEKVQAVNTFNALWELTLTDYFGVDLGLKHDFFIYGEALIDGPSSATTASSEFWNELPYGFELGLELSGTFQSEYVIHDLPTYGTVAADGQSYTGVIYLEAAPFDWISFTVSQQIQKSTWVVSPTEAEESFKRNQPDWQQAFVAKASLSLLF